MSFGPAADFAGVKGPDSFGQSFIDPCKDLFDEYLTFEPADHAEGSIPIGNDSTFMARSNSGSWSAGTPACQAGGEGGPHYGHDTWQGATWDLAQNAASPHQTLSQSNNLPRAEESGRDAISDSELLNLEGFHLQTPDLSHFTPSLPSTPSPAGASLRKKHRVFGSLSRAFKRRPQDNGDIPPVPVLSPSRKSAKSEKSPKMMRASQYSHSDLQGWGQRLAIDAPKFDFGFNQPTGQLSPPLSARVSEASDSGSGMMAMGDQHGDSFGYEHGLPSHYPIQRHEYTPLATPVLDNRTSRRSSHHASSSVENIMYQPATPQHHEPVPSWSQAPQPDFDSYGQSASYTESAPVWWSHPPTTPGAQPSPSPYHNDSRHSTKSLALQLQNELAYNAQELSHSVPSGLMIQMPSSPRQQSYIIDSSPMQHNPSYFPSSNQQLQSPPQLYMPQQHAQTLPRNYRPAAMYRAGKTEPRGTDLSDSSPSPSSNPSPSFQIAKRRTVSRKRSDLAPRTPVAGSGMADFVNFTPSDSTKILTGVAPSGSSKTKARREKEAMEKRRRLSMAAMRAVQAAGGDVESLVEEGLFA